MFAQTLDEERLCRGKEISTKPSFLCCLQMEVGLHAYSTTLGQWVAL